MKLALGLVLVALLAGCGGAGSPSSAPTSSPAPSLPLENPSPGDHELAILDADGTKRRYLVHAPSGYSATSGKKYPLVLVSHGQPGAPEDMVKLTKLNEIADANGFLVLYPNGIRDVPTILRLLDAFGPKWSVDPKRVHATGFSRGAAFTYELAEKQPGRFGSVAPVSGAGGEGSALSSPVSLLTFQGGRDRIQSAFAVANANWTKSAGCSAAQVKTITMEKGPTHIHTSQCRGGAEHIIYDVTSMSHEWPEDASRLMWEFFVKHPLP